MPLVTSNARDPNKGDPGGESVQPPIFSAGEIPLTVSMGVLTNKNNVRN